MTEIKCPKGGVIKDGVEVNIDGKSLEVLDIQMGPDDSSVVIHFRDPVPIDEKIVNSFVLGKAVKKIAKDFNVSDDYVNAILRGRIASPHAKTPRKAGAFIPPPPAPPRARIISER